jgi:hypothetical protein
MPQMGEEAHRKRQRIYAILLRDKHFRERREWCLKLSWKRPEKCFCYSVR